MSGVKVTNLDQLAGDFDRIAKRLGLSVVTVQKKLAFDIFAGVVSETPVDTGRAMNNWNISVGFPDSSITDGGGSESGIKTSKQATAVAALGGLPPFSTVWISNSLPYIVPLNEGSSDQAPSGYIDRVIVNELATLGAVL